MSAEHLYHFDRDWIVDELISLAQSQGGEAQVLAFLAFLEGYERESVLNKLFWRALDDEAWGIADLCIAEGFEVTPLTGNTGPIHVWLMRRTPSPKALEWLIQHGADIETREASCNYTPLMVACTENNVAAVTLLIQAGADANATTIIDDNESVLMCAAKGGNEEIVRLLLKHHAAIDHCTSCTGRTAAMIARSYHHDAVAGIIDAFNTSTNIHTRCP